MNPVVAEQSLRSRILQEVDVADQPDSNLIADGLLDDLSPEEVRHLAVEGLRLRVRKVFCELRDRPSASSSRWDSVAKAQRSGELDLARVSVFTGQSVKWLLDCSAADLADASIYETRVAFAHEAYAEKLDKLGKALKRKTDASVVGDLDPEKVPRYDRRAQARPCSPGCRQGDPQRCLARGEASARPRSGPNLVHRLVHNSS